MAVSGIGPREFQFQAFEALSNKQSAQKAEESTKQDASTEKLGAEQKEDQAMQIFKLSVEKEQGKGINLNLMG